ncbi:MAG: cytochrome b/b6 domain-containing protein [Coleofasciculaceae cyanobacterium RL_1_1]|nr:cytochrome b/b6 domain-containing protein [Coleofasciculaceae cyanobacterium RL_1_1]
MPTHRQPYQPLLLRLLHSITGIITIAAILTAYWTYDTFDRRWGYFLPEFKDIEGIHGTFGLFTLLMLPLLLVYACHRGARRLIQPDTIAQMQHLDQPIGHYSLHRVINTLSLVTLAFAVFSGKMMDVTWLPKGELHHFWYSAHLVSWVIMIGCIAAHTLVSARIGGVPLLQSIWRWSYRPTDSPTRWGEQVQGWWRGFSTFKLEWQRLPGGLQILEGAILVSVILAWIVPIFKH